MVTKRQALSANRFHKNGCTQHVGPKGGVRVVIEEWRRNGATKTWKTRPADFQVPVKYGIRTYGYLNPNNAHLYHVAEECPLIAG